MGPFKKGWYLIYTKPRQENAVTHFLSRQGITFFFPKTDYIRRWHDRNKKIRIALFPSYIFVWLNSQEEFYCGLGCDGVCNYVRFSNRPAIVSQTVIDQINLIIGSNESINISTECFTPGQKISIGSGPLAGISGEVVQHHGKNKLLIRIQLLNRSVLVDLRESVYRLDYQYAPSTSHASILTR